MLKVRFISSLNKAMILFPILLKSQEIVYLVYIDKIWYCAVFIP